MKRVYVAGAIGSTNALEVFRNIGRGIDLAMVLLSHKLSPFCPHLDFPYVMRGHATPIDVSDLYAYSMEWLRVSDAVVVVTANLYGSAGTRAEIAEAERLGLPVFYDNEIERVLAWAKG